MQPRRLDYIAAKHITAGEGKVRPCKDRAASDHDAVAIPIGTHTKEGSQPLPEPLSCRRSVCLVLLNRPQGLHRKPLNRYITVYNLYSEFIELSANNTPKLRTLNRLQPLPRLAPR